MKKLTDDRKMDILIIIMLIILAIIIMCHECQEPAVETKEIVKVLVVTPELPMLDFTPITSAPTATPSPLPSPTPTPSPAPTLIVEDDWDPIPTATPIPTNTPKPTEVEVDAEIILLDDGAKYYEIPYNKNYKGFKSYMGYKSITRKDSYQYKLQDKYAYTNDIGIRMVNDRYCIAIGSYFNCNIGQYVDIILENGTIIPCIMGDLKANQHTDGKNVYSLSCWCCSEFIIDSNVLIKKVKDSGNLSNAYPEWNSKVKAIKVYKENVFESVG